MKRWLIVNSAPGCGRDARIVRRSAGMNGFVTGTVGTTNSVGDQPTCPVAVVLL